MGSKKLKKKTGGKKSGVKISWKIKNQKSWKKSGGEKEAASELLFGLGVNAQKIEIQLF